MDYVAITLSAPQLDQPKDLLLPLDIPQYILLNTLIQVLGIGVVEKIRGTLYVVQEGTKRMLPAQRSLREAGVRFGQFLFLDLKEASARASLQCLQGPEYDLDKDQTYLGCRSDMDIDLRIVPKQEYVSGRHAKIMFRGGRFSVTDLGSANGTKVNGKPIPVSEEHYLSDGDMILLGVDKDRGIQLTLKIRK